MVYDVSVSWLPKGQDWIVPITEETTIHHGQPRCPQHSPEPAKSRAYAREHSPESVKKKNSPMPPVGTPEQIKKVQQSAAHPLSPQRTRRTLEVVVAPPSLLEVVESFKISRITPLTQSNHDESTEDTASGEVQHSIIPAT